LFSFSLSEFELPDILAALSPKTESVLDDSGESAGMADQSSHKIAFREMIGNEAKAPPP
jgi:hypothetical protein